MWILYLVSVLTLADGSQEFIALPLDEFNGLNNCKDALDSSGKRQVWPVQANGSPYVVVCTDYPLPTQVPPPAP